MNEETEYIIKTTDKDEMKAMLDAVGMKESIYLLYDGIFKKYLECGDHLTEEQYKAIESLWDETREYFEDYLE